MTHAYSWSPPGPTGTSAFTLCYASVYIRTAFLGSCATPGPFYEVCGSADMLQSVVQPDGTAWTFTYDGANPNDTNSIGYGDLLKIGFPTGGSISYTYATEYMYGGFYQSGMPTTQSRSVVTRSVDANDGTGAHTWRYNWVSKVVAATSTSYVVENTVTSPLLDDTVHQITGFFGGPSLFETQTRYYQGSQSSGTLLKTVNTDYSYSSNPFDNLGPMVNPPTAINVAPIRVTTIWANGQTTKEEKDYDSAGFTFHDPTWNLPIYPPMALQNNMYNGTLGTISARREYDYGAGSPGNLLQQTFTTYLWQGNSNYLTANMLDLPSSVVLEDGNGTRMAEIDSTYDESQYLTSSGITTQHGSPPGPVRGNLSTVSRWLNTGNPVVTHTNWYDTGEVYQAIDALGNATTHSYDPYYVGAYSTKTCLPTVASVTQCVSGTYDFNSGLLTSFTDQNGAFPASGNTPGDFHNTWNYTYDNMFRMTKAVGPPDYVYNHPETDFNYLNATTVQRKKSQDANGNWITDYAYFDGLGRTKQTRLADPDPRGDDYVDTTYDVLGRVSTVSNPHRSASSPTDGITTTQYDALGRVTQVTKPDGSASTVSYSGNCTTATDEAGKSRKSCSDGLGRLTGVWENPAGVNYETDYQYDALGNLLRVDQKGAGAGSSLWRTRLFTYDSLSRLLTAYNPESGTITYSYDANGNLFQKTSPAPNQTGTATQTITYCYDQLNRITGKAYSAQTCNAGQLPAGTAVAAYMYDTFPPFSYNFVGRLVEDVTYDRPSGTMRSQNMYDYDSMGRTFVMEQGCGGGDCSDPPSSYAEYVYDVAGEVTSLHTFEGSIYDVTYNYTYNTAGRLTSMSSSLSDAQHPPTLASNISYNPTGAMEKMSYGNGLTATNVFNSRLQPCRANVNSSGNALQNCGDAVPGGNVLDLKFGFNLGSGDNGNVASMTAVGSQNFNRSYGYDTLNRLTSYSAPGDQCTGLTWSYDPWGNRLSQTGTGGTCNSGPGTVLANNQLVGYNYDAAGNMTWDGVHSYTYDAENRVISVDSGAVQFVYDAQGKRVGKITNSGGQWRDYLYGTQGEVLSEATMSRSGYAWPAGYAYLGGQLLAEYENSTTSFVHHDHLGSTRLMTAGWPSTRIQSSGGTSTWKYYYTGVCPGTSGVVYTISVWIKNQGTTSMKISGNIVDGPVIAPGMTQLVSFTETGNGVACIQLGFATVNVGDGMDVLAFAPSITAAGGSNMIPAANQNFAGWISYQGSSVTITQGQTLSTRIQSSGGTNTWKYYYTGVCPGTSGVVYTISVWIKNQGTSSMKISGNIVDGSVIAPGTTQQVSFTETGNGVACIQLGFATVNVGDGMDVLAFAPSITAAGGSNMIPAANQDFSGWNSYQGASVTITEGQTPMIVDSMDYLPYGEQIAGGWGTTHKFTGKERDSETGLDYFGARYYGNAIGRFITPDWAAKPVPVPFATIGNPQTLNLYSYTGNNPTTLADADGHDVILKNSETEKRNEAESRVEWNLNDSEKKLFKQELGKDGKYHLRLDKAADRKYKGAHTKAYSYLKQAVADSHKIGVQIAETAEVNGRAVSVANDYGGGLTLANRTTHDSEVYLAEGGVPGGTVQGANGGRVPDPPGMIAGHEVLGHARLAALGLPHGEREAVGVENELRRDKIMATREVPEQ